MLPFFIFSKPPALVRPDCKDITLYQMQFDINEAVKTLIEIGSALGLGSFLTWRYQRRRAKAEADSAEANAAKDEASAAKELQDVYQQLIADIKTDRDEQKSYIQELKDDRRHLREERDSLSKRQDELEETVRSLQHDVARNGRMVEFMRPFLCGRTKCQERTSVTISEDGEVHQARKPKTDNNKPE